MLRKFLAAARLLTGLGLVLTPAGTAQAAAFALNFNASSNDVAVPHSPALNSFPLTVTAWLQTTSTNGQQGLVNKYLANSLNGWNLFLRNGHVRAWYFVDNTRFVWDGTNGLDGGLIADGLWHHLAFVVSTTGGRLYVDGVLKDSRAWTGAPGSPTTTQEMRLGSYPGDIQGVPGPRLLDEITVWRVALSQPQIQTNMNVSLTGSEADLLAYYRCDEGSGTTLTDSAPVDGSNNGTLTNGATFAISGVLPPPIFTLAITNLTGTSGGGAAWGDYDGDGRLDILLAGTKASAGFTNPPSQLWRNTGSGFSNINAALPGVFYLSTAWADFDSDGRLDFLLNGATNYFAPDLTAISQVWRNTGTAFSDANAGLPGVYDGASAWGDYDNDGRLDLLLTGTTSSGVSNSIWRNTGTGFTEINPGLTKVKLPSVAWGDYDNDGRLDLLLTGYDPMTGPVAEVWRNTGNGFTNINAGLPSVANSSVAWGDYDNDGRLDILLTGKTEAGELIAQVWRNLGNGFSNINAGLPGIGFSSVAWGDYDNDGRLDILLTGASDASTPGAIAQIWRNTGNGFTNINAGLPGVYYSSVAWGDYDNDGRLDILLTGATISGQIISQVWRNNSPITNTPPAAPTGLAVNAVDNALIFSWNAATDAQTPVNGLTYNLRVGSSPGGTDIVPAMALGSGIRLLPQMGNAQHRTNWTLARPGNQTFYWGVQAVDTAFSGSAFATGPGFALHNVLSPPGSSEPTPGDLNGDGIVSQSELDLVLSNYFPYSPWLYLTNFAGLGGTNVTFALTNSFAGAFSVEYSTNLLNWLFLGSATPRYEFTDTNAPAQPQRSYRLRWP